MSSSERVRYCNCYCVETGPRHVYRHQTSTKASATQHTRADIPQLTIPVRLFSHGHALDHNLALPAVCRAVRRDSRVKRVCVCATHPPTRSGTCMLQQIFMFIFISPHQDGRSRDFTHQRRLISSHSPRCRQSARRVCSCHMQTEGRMAWGGGGGGIRNSSKPRQPASQHPWPWPHPP